MAERPHDIADLYLAPVALEVDARIADLGSLDGEQLALQVAAATDGGGWTAELRKDALLRTVSHLIDLHGWTLAWEDRGIRLAHGTHALVLGAPANFSSYAEGSTS
jgi:hypothetical protein